MKLELGHRVVKALHRFVLAEQIRHFKRAARRSGAAGDGDAQRPEHAWRSSCRIPEWRPSRYRGGWPPSNRRCLRESGGQTRAPSLLVSGVDLLFLLVKSAISSSGISARKSTMPGSWLKISVRACKQLGTGGQGRTSAGRAPERATAWPFQHRPPASGWRMYSALNHVSLFVSKIDGLLLMPFSSKMRMQVIHREEFLVRVLRRSSPAAR